MEAGGMGIAASAACQWEARMFMICFFIFRYSSNLHRVFISIARPRNFAGKPDKCNLKKGGERIPEES
jgi:hypothetical protein